MKPARSLLPVVTVGLLGALPYLPSLSGDFVNYDDPYLVQRNRVLTEGRLTDLFDPTSGREALGSEFLPLRDLSWALELRLLGAQVPLGPREAQVLRTTNALLYGLACALAFAFLWRLFEAPRGPERSRAAWWAAAAFALHPVHAESVAWISGRKDVLAAVFVFATLLAYLRARAAPRSVLWLELCALLAACACLSKSTSTALPFLLLAVEVLDPGARRDPWSRRLLRIAPTFLVCAAAATLAAWVGRATGVGRGLDFVALLARLPDLALKDLVVLRHYLVLSFAPVEVRINHPTLLAALDPAGGLARHAALAALALGPLAFLLLRSHRRLPRFAALWFLGGLLPVLNLIPFSQWVADRFLCLPVLGPCALLAWVLVWLARRRPRLAQTLALSFLCVWGLRTGLRARDFRDSFALWEAQLRVEPGDPLAQEHLGRAYLRRGLEGRSRQDVERAAQLLAESVRGFARARPTNPGHAFEAAFLLAQARAALGAPREALLAGLAAHEALLRPGAVLSPQQGAVRGAALARTLKLLANELERRGDPADRPLIERARAALAALEPVR
ncbi:MAG: hypothetical protein D6731_12610 [Planctomycetota bacterium]|nr:MAG: hypothetical protein D6731_12610 [Planctomycetota bacterium]